ncbi:uncharacterized protein LOC116015896 [Ipomoea triloba]|uniref:uncharacterized protein LOC116015896 n=1 Tax=Ipomoea triloba TaxID=35885 RepID=UPI00125D4CA7|nr:uncharacterized protein LOC116015896 [Ipomoea triloba]
MAICRHIGYPNLFVTFTCNPKWPEIQRYITKKNLNAEDRPDILCRIFKMKLDCLIKEVKNGELFGPVKSVIYTIEFQKRGLPHAHILIFLKNKADMTSPTYMDSVIKAEVPDKIVDMEYYNAVEEFMVHGPCGIARRNSPCMVNGKCSKHFPKRFVAESGFDQDGYPIYMCWDDGRTVKKNGIELDSRYVVPHNRYLLLRYKAHINIEWCNQSRSIKYLFKYVNKDNDRVTAEFYNSTTNENGEGVVDEINMYYDCRYVSACEAAWRLFSFEVQYRTPAVERLSFHLPNCQSIVFADDENIDNVLGRETVGQSMFKGWLEANKKYEDACLLTYIEMPNKFVWKKDIREWHPRKKGFSVGHIFFVPPGSGEVYYLRCLLNIVRGPTSFKDIMTFNGVEYLTFKDACYARGLLDDDKEYIDAIEEASHWSTGHAMRKLFVILLLSNSLSGPEHVWDEVWHHLAEDAQFMYRKRLNKPDFILKECEKKNFGLIELEKMLMVHNKSLKDFPPMPTSNMDDSRLKEIYNTIIQDLSNGSGGLFFVYGYGGTGKTYLWRALSSTLQASGDIVINVASSGIASLLLLGGRTAHSRFSIPIAINEDSTCNIKQGSHLAELIVRSKLIIWDEAPMMHKHCIEALDRTMRDLLRFQNPNSANQTFGGKTVVFGGDFRQILPVVPKGSRQDIVSATINSLYLWNSCKVLRLTKNLRLNRSMPGIDLKKLEDFADWISSIGDGTMGGQNDGHAEGLEYFEFKVRILEKLFRTGVAQTSSILVQQGQLQYLKVKVNMFVTKGRGSVLVRALARRCEGSVVEDIEKIYVLKWLYGYSSLLEGRAILAPTLDVVNSINEYMSDLHTGDSRTYYSCDSVCKSDSNGNLLDDVHTPEFLNGIRASDIPNHSLTLKVGSPVMLLRNIDHSLGLCNGTRLVVTKLADHVIEGKIMSGNNGGTKVLVPRMTITQSDPRLPFKFQKRQFNVVICNDN